MPLDFDSQYEKNYISKKFKSLALISRKRYSQELGRNRKPLSVATRFNTSEINQGQPLTTTSQVGTEITSLRENSGNCDKSNPGNICLFKVNNRNTRKRCKIYLKLTIKTPERREVFIAIFEHISHLFLVFLLLTLSK